MTDRYRKKRVSKGSHIYIEGDEESSNLFLLKTGAIKLKCTSGSFIRSINRINPGDFFGFISAFSSRPRTCTAIAVENSAFIEFTRENFFRYFTENTDLTMKILGSFSNMLHEYDKLILNIKPISLIYPQSLNLFKLGEFYLREKKHSMAEYIFSKYIELYPDDELADRASTLIDQIVDQKGSRKYEHLEDKGILYYPDGSVIFSEFEPGDLLYFIKSGKVKIVKQNREKEIILAILGEEEIFGELALLTSSPRSATAISTGGVQLMPVDLLNFKSILQNSPDLVKKIFISISQRLWFNHLRLSLISYRKPITRLYAFLENKLMEDSISLKSKIKHSFQFGIDELLEMNDIPYGMNSDVIDELTDNPYLNFNFGNISVNNVKEFIAIVNVYKQRDHISTPCRKILKRKDKLDQVTEYEETILCDTAENTAEIEKEITETIPELKHEDPIIRVNAVIRLGSLGTRARNSADSLRELLGDDVKNIRRNAARSLINILGAGESMDLFKAELENSSSSVRSSALSGLSEINAVNSSEIVSLLQKSLGDNSPKVRSTAARSLGYLGKEAVTAIPSLLNSLLDRDKSVRILSINSLEQIVERGSDLKETIDEITRISKKDEDRYVQRAARNALVKLQRKRKLLSK